MVNIREQQLCNLFTLLINTLINRLDSGNATYQDFEVIRKLLADNGINAQPKSGELMEGLEKLPFEAENITTMEETNL